MYDDALPRKRKNDEYESFIPQLLSALVRLLWRLTRGSFHVLVTIPLRWTWRVTVWLARILWQATIWSAKAPFRFLGWLLHGLNILINGRMPEFETAREREIYRRIKRRFRRRNRLYTHLFAFVMGNGVIWIEWLSRPYYWRTSSYLSPYAFITLAWVIILSFHYFRLRLADAEDDALEAALEREYEREARSQPLYYEEIDEYYGEHDHLADEPLPNSEMADWPKTKRRRMNS